MGGGDEYNSLMISVLFIVSFLLSMSLTRQFINPSSWLRVMDHPNERSLHSVPTPRTGGLAIMITFFVVSVAAVLLLDLIISPTLLLCALAVMAISFLDDCYSVSAAIRFGVHLAVAVVLVMNGFQLTTLELPGVSWPWHNAIALLVSTLFIVWMINLYNFMDGMDGFAAGMAIAGFSCFALLGWQAQHQSFIIANLIVVGAVLGFLLFNFPPARVFMGDAGSSTLGFLVAAFTLWATVDSIFPFWVALLIFSPFIVDASVTLIRRLFAGERIWEAHKSHSYQRLVEAGWGHRKTVLYAYLLMVLCAASAWWAMQATIFFQLAIVAGWIGIYTLIIIKTGELARRHEHQN